MARTEDSYRLSRWNAGRWYTSPSVTGVMPCLGRSRCVFAKDCIRSYPDLELPPEGEPCPIEQAYTGELTRTFTEQWSNYAGYIDGDLDDLVAHAAGLILRRERISHRTNRLWESDMSPESVVWHELEICHRLYVTALAEWAQILQTLDKAHHAYEVRQRLRYKLAHGLRIEDADHLERVVAELG